MESDDGRAEGGHSDVFPIIGIGASAGGVEACSQLLNSLSGDTGMAFVFVLHLDPRHESNLSHILGKLTSMPVVEAADGTPVQPNHVYVIPPNSNMVLKGDGLRVTPREQMRTPHLPIDQFFKSLAQEHESGAIGVVLSGSGSDGTLGVEEIKAAGGITIAQSEESAKFPNMPQSAVRSGCIDLVLPPEEIARELIRLSKHPYVKTEADEEQASISDETQFQKILGILRNAVGVDFRSYRDTTIRRRIMRRMVLHTLKDLNEYIEYLEQDPVEVEALYQDILINVTSFFREGDAFEALKEHVFPELVNKKASSSPIRIWVPGCSTGQEAYTLAMVLLEFLDDRHIRFPIQIFATDLSDTVSLHKAREGLYPENIEAEVSPERLRRFFTKEDGKYRINKSIRDLCVFAKQNVAADPPFSRVDLISCRNLLIYLAPPLQKRVIPTFHYALNPTGFLMLGASETIGSFSDLFELIDPKHRIYSKKVTAHRQYPNFHADEFSLTMPGVQRPANTLSTPLDWQREADRMVLGQYAPAGVLVNHDYDVLQFRGKTGLYLTPAPGEASFNVLRMAREGLFLELRSALNECRTHNTEVRRLDISLRTEAEMIRINLRVLPVKLPGINERCFLVLFEDPTAVEQRGGGQRPADAPAAEPGMRTRLARWLTAKSEILPHLPPHSSEEVANLRQELASTRDYLQSVIEQQDAANEELKSANEEILSSNEELQSTNEELETAKEELQSVNEELTTINEQLQNRNVELSRLNDDISNFLSSANVPMVALSVDQRIRRFTPSAAKLLNLLPTDVGRPINNIKLTVDIPDLHHLVSEVVDAVRSYERDVRDRQGRIYMLRLNPYRTADNKIDGVVLVLQDASDVRTQAEQLRRKVELINLSQDAIFTCDGKTGVINFWNQGAERTYGWSEQEVKGRPVREILGPTYPDNVDVAAILHRQGHWEGELIHKHRNGTSLNVESRQVWLNEGLDDDSIILEINRDITSRKKMEDDLKIYSQKLAESDRRKNEFLAMLAHELRNPLAPLRNAARALRLQAGADADPELYDILERQVKHLAHLVDDLLDVPRITHGRIELRKEAVDLNHLLEEIVADMQEYIGDTTEALALTLPDEPLMVEADPVRLSQIMENLLINAVKYSDRDTRVQVRAEVQNGEVVVTIRDHGIGISADMLPRIWDLFTQADSTLERTRGGLGIGLALVKYLVELHGGSVSARSDGIGKGSEFEVRLPQLVHERALRTPSRRPAAKAKKAAGRRILIVDDNVDAADSLAQLLQLLGHNIYVAYGGIEAIDVAKEFHPEIVLLDIGLPGLNGYEVARRLRKDGAKPYIVAISGYGSSEALSRGVEAGFDKHLLKPIDIDDLIEIIAAFKY